MATSNQEGQGTGRGLGGNQKGNSKPLMVLNAKLDELTQKANTEAEERQRVPIPMEGQRSPTVTRRQDGGN